MLNASTSLEADRVKPSCPLQEKQVLGEHSSDTKSVREPLR